MYCCTGTELCGFYFELLLKMNITKKTYSDLWITESGRRKRIETGKDFGESKSG